MGSQNAHSNPACILEWLKRPTLMKTAVNSSPAGGLVHRFSRPDPVRYSPSLILTLSFVPRCIPSLPFSSLWSLHEIKSPHMTRLSVQTLATTERILIHPLLHKQIDWVRRKSVDLICDLVNNSIDHRIRPFSRVKEHPSPPATARSPSTHMRVDPT